MNGVYHSDRHEHLALTGSCVRAGSTRNESRFSVGTEKRHGPVPAVIGRCCWFWCCCVGVFEPFFWLER
jgi:hypothetical protein